MMVNILTVETHIIRFTSSKGFGFFAEKYVHQWKVYITETGKRLPGSRVYYDMEFSEEFTNGELHTLIENYNGSGI